MVSVNLMFTKISTFWLSVSNYGCPFSYKLFTFRGDSLAYLFFEAIAWLIHEPPRVGAILHTNTGVALR